MSNLENQRVLHFEFQKLLRLYHNNCILLFCIDLSRKPYWGLWFNRTHHTIYILNVNSYCWTVWHHPHCNKSITCGTRDQNTTKKKQNLICRYLRLKFLCDQATTILGLILWENIFGVTIELFFFYC